MVEPLPETPVLVRRDLWRIPLEAVLPIMGLVALLVVVLFWVG